MEDRLARLESTVAHIQTDVSDIKTDMRGLRSEMRELRTEVRQDVQRLDGKIDSVKDSVAALALQTEKSLSNLKLWALLLYIMMAAGMLTLIARAFKWI